MKVSDLIAKLQAMPQDALVVVPAESSGYHDCHGPEIEPIIPGRTESKYNDLGKHSSAKERNEYTVDAVVIW